MVANKEEQPSAKQIQKQRSDLRSAHNLHIQTEPLLPSDASNKQTTQNTRDAVCACKQGHLPIQQNVLPILTRLQTANSFNGSWELLQKIPAQRKFNNR
jgi:hypothetical protein